ncbi:hypothetical protein DKX38_011989 [Salix brachista]|uniref:Uncharacterized protein n=1 Tax=Salix brachista TaxID=2182728 RepID=A0A5N5M2X9_9ROSI|nr:hypothetical protein DKX38_011989 [Salix brachista]
MPAPSPHIGDLESVPSSQPQPSPSNTTSESQAPPSPQSPSGVRDPLPHTINESQRNNILDAKLDLEKELKKTLLGLCFGAALQFATPSKQVVESEINNSISLLSLGTAAIFASLFTSHFIGEKMPNASRMLDKVAFFLAATTFFFAIATPCPLSIKCAIWALYIISLMAIATCNFPLVFWRQVIFLAGEQFLFSHSPPLSTMAVTADILFVFVFFLLMHRQDHERNQDQDPGLPAPSPHIDDLESGPSSQPQPSPSNTSSESQAPPSPQSPSGVRELLPHTINESRRNNILDATPGLNTLLSLFVVAFQIRSQYKQVAESEINNSISLLALGIATIFGCLLTSHFIREKMPNASLVLEKVAFFLAATTFFFAIATPCPLGIKCAIWAVYIISLIVIAICNFL